MNNQSSQKSLFWIITTLVITTSFIGGLIYGIPVLAIIFIRPSFLLALPFVVRYPLLRLFLLVSLIAGLKYALNFIQQRTEIGKEEAKKIAIFIACLPLISLLLVVFPYQIYYRGVRIAIRLLWETLPAFWLLWSIEDLPLAFLSYYWLKEKSVSTPVLRKTIKNYELLLLALLFVAVWIPPMLDKEGWKKELGTILLTGEEYQKKQEEKQEKIKEVMEDIEIGKDWLAVSYMRQIRDKFYHLGVERDYKPGTYTDVSCEHVRIEGLCQEIKEAIGIEPILHSSSDEYCGYIKLPSGGYFCIDTSGLSIRTSVDLSVAGYCDGTTFACPREKESEREIEQSIYDLGVEVFFPIGGEQWQEGGTYPIKWRQWGLEGKKVRICLWAFSISPQSVSAKEGYRGECPRRGYQIKEEILAEANSYDWEIPINLSDQFSEAPDYYRIEIMPVETKLEGVARNGFSDFFKILGKKQ